MQIKVESAGLCADLKRQLTKEIASSADQIFVMEPYMKKFIVRDYSQPPEKIDSFNIPDGMYEKDDPGLVKWIEEELEKRGL